MAVASSAVGLLEGGDVMRDGSLRECGLQYYVQPGLEGIEERCGGACTLSWSVLPEFRDCQWGDSAKVDVNVGAQEVCVRDFLQLDWFVVKPFLVELQHGW